MKFNLCTWVAMALRNQIAFGILSATMLFITVVLQKLQDKCSLTHGVADFDARALLKQITLENPAVLVKMGEIDLFFRSRGVVSGTWDFPYPS